MTAYFRRLAICTLAIVLPVLASCETVEMSDIDDEDSYFAAGTEPFWSFGVTDGEMRFRMMDGDEISMKSFTRRELSGGRSEYRSSRITADMSPGPCNDGMSDRSYRDNVVVRVNKQEYRGCGGGLVLPANLAGTTWRLDSINGVKVQEPEKTEISFDGQKMAATTGCNRMSGSYTVNGAIITFSPVAATKMACPGGQSMQLEAQFLVMLTSPVTHRFKSNGEWELSSNSGYRAVLTMVG